MTHMMLPDAWPDAWIAAAAALRTQREAAGISLDQLAERTRIGRTHLEWIEGARFDRCGAPIYAIGFARAIARTLELAETPILASIRAGHAERAPGPPEPATARPVRRSSVPSLGLVTTATFLLTLLGVVRG